MNIELNKSLGIEGSSLLCPTCREHSLHHYKVVSEFRYQEDGGSQRTTATGGCYLVAPEDDCPPTKITSTVEEGVNVSNRRDNIYIHFCCEQCGIIKTPLCIFQHKGDTKVRWKP